MFDFAAHLRTLVSYPKHLKTQQTLMLRFSLLSSGQNKFFD
jgi:hypothetical protein